MTISEDTKRWYAQMVTLYASDLLQRVQPPKRLVMACGNGIASTWRPDPGAWWCELVSGSRGCCVYPYEVAYVTRERLLNRMAE